MNGLNPAYVREITECYLVILRREGLLGDKLDPVYCVHYRCLSKDETETCALGCTAKTCHPVDKRDVWKRKHNGIEVIPGNKGWKEKPRPAPKKKILCTSCGMKKTDCEQYETDHSPHDYLCKRCAKKKGLLKQ
jgi:hypothetical protein